MANSQGKQFLLDSSGELLKEGIKGTPYFIKPNKDEIEALNPVGSGDSYFQE